VSGSTIAGCRNARETVMMETLASRATSVIRAPRVAAGPAVLAGAGLFRSVLELPVLAIAAIAPESVADL
jgi:hypothetical protein